MSNELADFADYIFDRLMHTIDGLSDEELNWRPVEETNNIHWILTHTTRIAYLLIPQVLSGTHNPAGWDDDYEQQKHTIEDLRKDLLKARKLVVNDIRDLDEKQLEKKINIWGKERPLKEPIFALLGELLHHNGQMAMLRGIYKRTTA